ncbi:ATP synthase subunit delta, chloroplastic-like [Cucurbita maxima]|uniref:ATP synthase subunit delta, chloroplastic-like n=1 Tax=Cucurbita maxima TaxID=3661 RepID=A0A6J1I8U4_CUCMA|nr:ATP synthase subunit delta, chloroplastic-like [Cucurbita maxima]
MAAFHQTAASLQAKLLPTIRISRTTPANLSFSATFPSGRLRLGQHRSHGGARMSASAAGSYAAALAEVAASNNTLDATSGDVEKIESVFADSQVFDCFANPTISIEKKLALVDEIAASSSLLPHTANFLKILVDAKRIDIVKEIVTEFESVYNKITNTELAVVSSVVPLEQQHLAQIAKQVQKLSGAKNVRIKTQIDPSLVAGFTVRFGNSGSKLIDLSVKKQLEEIASQLDLGNIQLAV